MVLGPLVVPGWWAVSLAASAHQQHGSGQIVRAAVAFEPGAAHQPLVAPQAADVVPQVVMPAWLHPHLLLDSLGWPWLVMPVVADWAVPADLLMQAGPGAEAPVLPVQGLVVKVGQHELLDLWLLEQVLCLPGLLRLLVERPEQHLEQQEAPAKVPSQGGVAPLQLQLHHLQVAVLLVV
jgi:hypothetical protein